MQLYTRPLLTDSELKEILLLLTRAEWGRHSSVESVYLDTHQKNSEMLESPDKRRISEIVFNAINRDDGFRDLVFPERSTYIIVSKTEVGQGFKVHHDMPSNGDFSTTIFLSDPESYEGGQLQMLMGDSVTDYALPAGHAITYYTGIPHCVAEVTKGVRYAIVFWTTSIVKDARYRDILADLRKVKKMLPRDYGYDLPQAVEKPHFILQGIENKILRHFLTADALRGH
jgi:PKHD-type hydroxylase